MNRCPITYEEIPTGAKYSAEGLKQLSRRLTALRDFPYTVEEQRREAIARASKMSIQGLQPKLSARLDVSGETFEVVDTGGNYILKPPSDYPEVPENEDLTMRLAASAGIEVPLHGLIYCEDSSLTYVIRRFDRTGRKGRLHVEDFAQLSGKTRDTKYDSSMEQVASVIDEYMTFPALEKLKLFKLTLFSFLVGNEDMHLKNFSLIIREGKSELSPAYDLLNSTIAIGNAKEEIALPIDGKKRNLTRRLLIEYYGKGRLGLRDQVVDDALRGFISLLDKWESTIRISFLSEAMKGKYLNLLRARFKTLQS